MKTIVKLTTGKSITVEPCNKTGGLLVGFEHRNGSAVSREEWHMTPDQWDVLADAGDISLAQQAVMNAAAVRMSFERDCV